MLLTAAEIGLPSPSGGREHAYLLSDYPVTIAVIEGEGPRVVSLSDADLDPAEAWVLRDLGMHSVLILRLVVDAKPWGLVEIYDKQLRRFEQEEIDVAELLVGQAAGLLARFSHEAAQERLYRETLASLSNALEAKDLYTSRHAQEVVELVLRVSGRFDFTGEQVRTLKLAALLHDIGKVRVPESILNKRGPLTEGEWEIMHAHPEAGERILEPITTLRHVLPLVRSHQERWDGRGYPDGLAGANIPLGARIIAVCDAYCAMVEDRPYRSGLEPSAALAELEAQSGTQFDPACVRTLQQVLHERDHPREAVLLRPR